MEQEKRGIKPQITGLKHIYHAFFYSMDGFKATFQNEAAFRIELLVGLFLVPIAHFLPFSTVMTAIMVASLMIVLMVEVLNSAIETIVDWISLEQHPMAKRAKDMGSAAVFLSQINVLIVWGFCIYGTFFK